MEKILMSVKERKRLEVFSRVKEGRMTLVEAGQLLQLSYRQTKRVWGRYQQSGDQGLVHQARGRASNRQASGGVKERALALYREKYADYGPTLAAECLASEDGVEVKITTLRRWLLAAGLWERQRRRKAHRQRRQRRARAGELLQMDGSHHDWFEGRRQVALRPVAYAGWAVLMVLIDDATGRVFARFYENESWASAADAFGRYAKKHGLPRALYVDQHSIYRADREPAGDELLADFEPETQFGRAMRELDVELILARSPQAKGRVERMNGTLQDRLVKALRRAGINDIESANAYLESTFLPEFNARFAVPAASDEDWHRELPATTDLARVLSIAEARVVHNDWTVRWRNGILQLPRESSSLVQPKQSVTVCEQLDGLVRVFVGDVELSWAPFRTSPASAAKQPALKRKGGQAIRSNQGQKPRADHPWRGRLKEPSVPG